MEDEEARRIAEQKRIDVKVDMASKFTGAYVAILLVYVLIQHGPVLAMRPNEFGDFLAGAAAPLAFFWLVFGYGLQRDQLRLQSEELYLQRKELREATEANREQAEQLRKQAEILDLQHREAQARFEQQATPRLRMVLVERKGGGMIVIAAIENKGAAVTQLKLNSIVQPWSCSTLWVNEPFESGESAEIRANRPTDGGREPLTLVFTCKSTLSGDLFWVSFKLEDGRFNTEVRKIHPPEVKDGPSRAILGLE